MVLSGRKSKKISVNPGLRFVRSVLSVIVLAALVLGVTLGAKELYSLDSAKFGRLVSSLLSKVHINVSEEQVGSVAGKFAERISQTNLGSGVSTIRSEDESDRNVYATKDVLVKLAVLSDIHDDLINLEKALDEVRARGIEYAFVLGDLTGYGDVASLRKVKDVLDASGLVYYALPGDHDLAQSLDTSNFNDVFGKEYGKIKIAGYNFIYFNNSANFTKISPAAISWLENEISDADFILLSQPLYTKGLTAPFDKIYMGSTNGELKDESLADEQEAVLTQGQLLLSLIRRNPSLKAVVAGDHHKSSFLQDAERTSLMHYVVGAVTSTLNEYPQSALQTSRFSVLSIFQDGSYKIEDVVLD
ncbi:MAG: hypothetical protein KatS3mg101_0524 [Patescibacteria group bacterium]|nr:MAG: hypothetical protein KatS3mg101_0524 [Patescibacteria group bacterium]